jgi:hypothetical protein
MLCPLLVPETGLQTRSLFNLCPYKLSQLEGEIVAYNIRERTLPRKACSLLPTNAADVLSEQVTGRLLLPSSKRVRSIR